MSKRAFITGATGFVGGSLAERLVQSGWQLVALVRPGSNHRKLEALGVTLIYGELSDTQSYADALNDCDVVFHCAALTGVGHKIKDFWDVIATGTQAVLSTSIAAGVERFVLVSSIVACEQNVPPYSPDESRPLLHSSIDPYGRAKGKAESLCLAAHEKGDISVSVVRPVFVYGPGDRPGGFLPEITKMIGTGKFRLIGDGNNPIPLVYISDLVDLLMLCAESDKASGQIYNANSQDSPSWREFVERLCKECELPSPKSVSSNVVRPMATFMETLVKLKLLNTLPLSKAAVGLFTSQQQFPANKAIDELGYQPKVSFEQGMSNSAAMLKLFLSEETVAKSGN